MFIVKGSEDTPNPIPVIKFLSIFTNILSNSTNLDTL